MCKAVEFCFKNAKGIYLIGGIILAIAGWFFMINGLPSRLDNAEIRVSQLERDVTELKSSMAEQNTKMGLVLNAVYEIRGVLLKGK